MRESVDWEQLPSADVLLPYDDRVELPEVDNYSDEETLGKLLYRRRSVREFDRGSKNLCPEKREHSTPTYSSWINQVERWFGYLTEQLLQRSDHRSVQALERDIRNWVKA